MEARDQSHETYSPMLQRTFQFLQFDLKTPPIYVSSIRKSQFTIISSFRSVTSLPQLRRRFASETTDFNC